MYGFYDASYHGVLRWFVKFKLASRAHVTYIMVTYGVLTAVTRLCEFEGCKEHFCVGTYASIGQGSWKYVHWGHLFQKLDEYEVLMQISSTHSYFCKTGFVE